MFIVYGFPTTDDTGDNSTAAKLYYKLTTKVCLIIPLLVMTVKLLDAILLPPSRQVRTSVRAYGALSMCAEFGGYMGLLLGFSVLDLARLSRDEFYKNLCP